MRRLPTIIGAGLVAAATASAIAVTSGTAQVPGDRTLTLVERQVAAKVVFVDAPPLATKKRPNPGRGDGFLFENTLLDATGKTKVGSFRARCSLLTATRNFVGSLALCDGFHALGDGTITSSALARQGPGRIDFAVTGGTGAYEGARGSGTTKPRSARSLVADTTIHLLP